jgi:hypothetical protein
MFALYTKSVKPITAATTILAVYTRGYYDAVVNEQFRKKTSLIDDVVSMTESAVIGAAIGVTYPIGIPATLLYANYINNQ